MSLVHEKATTSDMLSCIEEFWRFGLPKDYREYLLEFNRKMPEKLKFDFKDKSDGSTLHSLYGFEKGGYNILLASKDMGSRYIDTMLPIGNDVYGNRILLTVKGKDRNKVFFWDHEMESEDDEEPSYDNLTLIADSFTEFMESLYDDEEEA